MHAIIVVFERLSASSLSCYGAARQTPAIDRVATKSDIFLHCYADDRCDFLSDLELALPSRQIQLNSRDPIPTLATDQQSRVLCHVSRELSPQADSVIAAVNEQIIREKLDDYLLIMTAITGKPSAFRELDRSVATTTAFDSDPRVEDFGEQEFSGDKGNDNVDGNASKLWPVEEAVHVPILIQRPGEKNSRRRFCLQNSRDQIELVRAACTDSEQYLKLRDETTPAQIEYAKHQQRAVRTNDWLLICTDKNQPLALFHKPEDVWEESNIVTQYPQIVEHFLKTGELRLPLAS